MVTFLMLVVALVLADLAALVRDLRHADGRPLRRLDSWCAERLPSHPYATR